MTRTALPGNRPTTPTSAARAGCTANAQNSAHRLEFASRPNHPFFVKPVAIFRHFPTEGPGYFATFLDRHSIPWTLIRIDELETVPDGVDDFSGLVFMGGPMSVNDPLPWIAQSCALIRAAVAAGLPVLGHCLGGQLIAKALGGTITRNPVKEIGWGPVRVLDNPPARDWFGNLAGFETFHWHGETFSIPPGAARLLESAHCANQAYALGKTFGMQCHVEMTEEMIRQWCIDGAGEIAAARSPAVQAPATMQAGMAPRVAALNAVADRIYTRWIEGLKRD
ncbi:MAG: type 1 glutamine amidotransferase [Rhodocyclaceae bacterium]|nr:type 1 glutamine amidotransferase [Rhodocyclaceae bacterium]